jgi:hypothetical protein
MCALKLNPVSEVNTSRDLFFQGQVKTTYKIENQETEVVVDEPPIEIILRILNYLNDRDLAQMREAGWRWNHCIINFPAFCTRLIARECIFAAKQLAIKHLQLTAPMEDLREQQGLMRVIRLEAQVDPERAKKRLHFLKYLIREDARLLKLSKERHYKTYQMQGSQLQVLNRSC